MSKTVWKAGDGCGSTIEIDQTNDDDAWVLTVHDPVTSSSIVLDRKQIIHLLEALKGL